MKRLLVTTFLLITISAAFAGGRGGHRTTFDPNSYGGGWTCFRTLASGTCGGATTQYFNAACDGTTNDAAAVTAWLSYGVSLGTAQAKLYLPPGSNCALTDGTTQITSGIKNTVVWGYDASFKITGVASNLWIGGSGLFDDNTHSALIQTVSAGSNTVTLVTAADSSIFTVGDWILVDNIAIQQAGYPPNFQTLEYKLITAITGTTTKVITLDSPLTNSYLSTLPAPNDAEHGGPATIHLLSSNWNTNVQIFGLTVKRNSVYGGNVIGRSVTLQDMTYESAPNFTQSQNLSAVYLSVGDTPELDKLIEQLTFYRFYGPGLSVQSASLLNLNVISSKFTYTGTNALNGTAQNTTLINSTMVSAHIGPSGNGKGQTLTLDGTYIGTATQSYEAVPISAFSYSVGVLTIARANGNFPFATQWAVPGAIYYFNYAGNPGNRNSDGTGNPVKFTITGMTGDATNYYIATDMVGSLPTPTFGGQAANQLMISPVVTVTQRNSPTGSASVTGFAAP